MSQALHSSFKLVVLSRYTKMILQNSKWRGVTHPTVQSRLMVFLKHKQKYCLATVIVRENISDVNTHAEKNQVGCNCTSVHAGGDEASRC